MNVYKIELRQNPAAASSCRYVMGNDTGDAVANWRDAFRRKWPSRHDLPDVEAVSLAYADVVVPTQTAMPTE